MRAKGVPAKVCGQCLRVLAHSQFAANRSAPDERQATCRACRRVERSTPEYRAGRRTYRQENREAVAARQAKYRQENREAIAARDAEYREENRSRPLDLGDGMLEKRCTTVANGGCERLLTRGDFPRKRSNADQRDLLCRECRARRNAERYLRRKLRLWDTWQEDGTDGECWLCSLPFTDDDPPETEHVVPRASGGVDQPANLLPAHASCNRGPGGKFDGPALDAWTRRMTLRGEDVPALADTADRLAARSLGVLDMATGEILEDWSLADAVSATVSAVEG